VGCVCVRACVCVCVCACVTTSLQPSAIEAFPLICEPPHNFYVLSAIW